MESIKIYVRKNMDGILFYLSYGTRLKIRELFEESNPTSRIFITYDDSKKENYLLKLETHIIPILIGLELEKLSEKIDEITVVDSENEEIIQSLILSKVEFA